MNMKIAGIIGGLIAASTILFACDKPADVASRNISLAADNFEVMRRIIFVNGITDSYIASIEGLCSLGNFDNSYETTVTCKIGPNQFTKDFFIRSDNTFIYVQQMDAVSVSTYHHRVLFRPQTILPDIDFQADVNELTTNRN
jgi:hypothetical protein